MWWGFALGLFLGAAAGVVVAGLGAAAKEGDRLMAVTELRRVVAWHHRARIGPCTDCIDANAPELAETKPGDPRWLT